MKLYDGYSYINGLVDYSGQARDLLNRRHRKLYYISRLDSFLLPDAPARFYDSMKPMYFIKRSIIKVTK